MKKVVFKNFKQPSVWAYLAYEGSLEKGAVIINKCKDPNVVMTLIQGRQVLGTFAGKGKVSVSEKTFPSIWYNKKHKLYYDMYVVFAKKDFVTVKSVAKKEIIKPVDTTVKVTLSEEAFFDTFPYSFVTLFKTSEIGFESFLFTGAQKRTMDANPGGGFTVLTASGVIGAVEVYVRDYLHKHVFDCFGMDEDNSEMEVEHIADISLRRRLFYKGLEHYVETNMASGVGVAGKCTVIGLSDVAPSD